MPKIKKAATKKPAVKEVPIRIKPDHCLESRRIYANYAAIDHSQLDFNIRFCDVPPAYQFDLTDETLVDPEIRVPVVAEIAIPTAMVPALIRALEENYRIFQASQEEPKTKDKALGKEK